MRRRGSRSRPAPIPAAAVRPSPRTAVCPAQLLPFFSGERSPGYRDDAAASILGLRRSTTRAHLVRAGMEAVCLRLAAIVDLILGAGDRGATGGEPPRHPVIAARRAAEDGEAGEGIVNGAKGFARAPGIGGPRAAGTAGGGARVIAGGGAMAASPLWKQMLADALGRSVQDSGRTEETSFGVAVLLSSMEGAGVAEGASERGAGGAGVVADGDGDGGYNQAGVVYAPREEAFVRYLAAREAQERAYRAIFGPT